jgi:hypothetical protein
MSQFFVISLSSSALAVKGAAIKAVTSARNIRTVLIFFVMYGPHLLIDLNNQYICRLSNGFDAV